MNYKNYAKILVEAEKTEENFENFFDKFIKLLNKKGELKQLPNILHEVENILEREKRSNKTKIILKNKSSFEKYKNEIENFSQNFDLQNYQIDEDENIIGGYILKNNKFKVDNSYKNKLLNLYEKITK